MSAKTKKEPLFHISRRSNIPTRKRLLLRVLSVLLAFFICSMVLVMYKGYNPISFISTLFKGTMGSKFNIFVFLGQLAILLGLGLALIPAFKMKFWNIGADGQALVGAIAAYIVLYFGSIRGNLPGGWALVISLFAAIVAGAIWGVIPAIFKAIWNTNETLFTLMMNYIAIQLALFLKYYIVFTIQKGKKTTIPIPSKGTLVNLFRIEQLIPIMIVILLVIFIAIYIKKTKHGYELSLVGDSENSAKYAGINVKWVIIRTMILSGAICGLIGWLLIVGNHQAVDSEITHSWGFTAIIVAWLAKFNPLYMIITAGLVAFIQIGMSDVRSAVGITSDAISNIFIGIIFFFIIAFEFFISYKINLRKNDDGEIDNKVLRWNYNKVYTPVGNFFNMIIDKIVQFFNFVNKKIKGLFERLFKKDKKQELVVDNATIPVENQVEDNNNEDIIEEINNDEAIKEEK